MSDESKEYLCNVLLIKALLQFLPATGNYSKEYSTEVTFAFGATYDSSSVCLVAISENDRKKVQEWLKKFQEIEEGCSEAKTRNEYAFYLLINVQNGNLSQPFSKPPPPGKLKPLCRILPDFLYEEIQKQFKVSYCRLNKMLSANNDNYEMPDLRCEPSGFQTQQPRPQKGLSALFAVFSNYDDETN